MASLKYYQSYFEDKFYSNYSSNINPIDYFAAKVQSPTEKALTYATEMMQYRKSRHKVRIYEKIRRFVLTYSKNPELRKKYSYGMPFILYAEPTLPVPAHMEHFLNMSTYFDEDYFRNNYPIMSNK